jgi:2-polyprenyl-6-methoxyphenol hydroxylase-like FAD-dependent oxidoreductase
VGGPAELTAASLPGTVPVVVAGGGPAGLTCAVELGRRGIGCLVIEPRTTVSRARPRCKTINVRSMQHLRRWGIADRLRDRAPLSPAWSSDAVFCTSLAGRELSRFTGVLGLVPEGDRFPELGQQAPQYVLEELLREVVRELPACQLATGFTVTGAEQDEGGVRVTVADRDGGHAVVTADYLIGCDGPRSVVRDRIGAAYTGEAALRPNFGMVFTAPDLWRHVRHGPAVHYWIINPAAPALMGPIDLDGTWWLIAFGVDSETGEREAARLIDAAAGVPSGAVVRSTDPWTARMQIADTMRRGRVFLAGDAAHLNPPFGGHGLNTGVGDAVDLGWKLAATLDGWGGPALLDSYELERRPIQERVIREATANMAVTSPELLADNLDADNAVGEHAVPPGSASSRPSDPSSTPWSSCWVSGSKTHPSSPASRTRRRGGRHCRGSSCPGCSCRGSSWAHCCRTPGSARADRSTTSSARGSRCWCAVRAPAPAPSRRRPAPGACRSACSMCLTRTLFTAGFTAGPRSRWSAPTSTWRGPVTASPVTAWP